MSKKIVIVGALGYLGTELCRLYSGESWFHNIIAIDNRFVSKRINQLKFGFRSKSNSKDCFVIPFLIMPQAHRHDVKCPKCLPKTSVRLIEKLASFWGSSLVNIL